MFKIRRPAIIGILVVLLVFTGYLNHQLTEQAQKKASKDYQNHELAEMEQNEENNVENASEGEVIEVGIDSEEEVIEDSSREEEEVDIVDSMGEDDENALETMYTQASESSKNYFVEYRLSRDKLRATLIDRLDEIVNNVNTNEKVREEAQREIMSIGNVSEKELQIEGLIKGKGYEDALVFLTEEDIKIVVSAVELKEQDMVKILEIVKSETDYDTNNIKIMKNQ